MNPYVAMSEKISFHVQQCLRAFWDLLSPQPTAEPRICTVLSDEFSRFKVWSGTIGAHKTGPSSLDYRLRDASHIREQVLSLLKELLGMIDDVSAIISGEIIPWDEVDEDEDEAGLDIEFDEDSPKTELEQIAADVIDVVNCLLRLTVDIKNPAPHQRFLETKLTDKTHFEPYDIQHVSSKFHNMDPWLAERLGKSLSRRRQYFKYREAHHEKLAAGLETAGPRTPGPQTSPLEQEAELHRNMGHMDYETVASSIPLAMKDNSTRAAPQPVFIQDDQSDTGVSQTSYATSAAAPGSLKIPPLPKEADKGPFQCPLCYTMIFAKDRNAWKKHVYADLRPYTCLAKDCIVPEREFGRRHEWMDHVQQNYWYTYSCPFGCDVDLSSASQCKAHFEVHHSRSLGSAQSGEIEAYVKLAQQPIDITTGIQCPFCNETITSAKQYRTHVGRHQEQLSLFALPSGNTEEGSDTDQDSDTASLQSRSEAGNQGSQLSENGEKQQEAGMVQDIEDENEEELVKKNWGTRGREGESEQQELDLEGKEKQESTEKQMCQTVGFCHTCKGEEYGTEDGTGKCAVCGSKLEIITPEEGLLDYEAAMSKGQGEPQARSVMNETSHQSESEHNALEQETANLTEKIDVDNGKERLNCAAGELARGGDKWFMTERLPEMTVCGSCYEEVVVPLQMEGQTQDAIPNSLVRCTYRLFGPVTCMLSSDGMRSVFRAAAKTGDWDTLKRKVLERWAQDQGRIRTESGKMTGGKLAVDFEVARLGRQVKAYKRREELKQAGAEDSKSILRTKGEIEAELADAIQIQAEIEEAAKVEKQRQVREGYRDAREMDNFGYEAAQAGRRRRELEKEKYELVKKGPDNSESKVGDG